MGFGSWERKRRERNVKRRESMDTPRYGHSRTAGSYRRLVLWARDFGNVWTIDIARRLTGIPSCLAKWWKDRQNTHPHTSCRDRRTVYVVQRPPYCVARDVTSAVARHSRHSQFHRRTSLLFACSHARSIVIIMSGAYGRRSLPWF